MKRLVKLGITIALGLGLTLGESARALSGPTVKTNNTGTLVTTQPTVILDNFSKYGMEKTQEFPFTVEVNGLSYTLHKMMIFPVNSPDAMSLIKNYQFTNVDEMGEAKYIAWTKITIKNNSSNTIQRSPSSLNQKWSYNFAYHYTGMAYPIFSRIIKHTYNSSEVLRNFILKPGASLNTYQALSIMTEPKTSVTLSVNYNGATKIKTIAKSTDK